MAITVCSVHCDDKHYCTTPAVSPVVHPLPGAAGVPDLIVHEVVAHVPLSKLPLLHRQHLHDGLIALLLGYDQRGFPQPIDHTHWGSCLN